MDVKEIKGYEGIYEAHSDGTIWSCKNKTTYSFVRGKTTKRVWKQREIKPQIEKRKRSNHYDKRVKLWKNKKMTTHLVSRLIAQTFIPNPENKDYVNHKNGNPLDNSVENLEWVTRSENIRHAFKNGLLQTNKKVTLVSKADGVTMKFDSLRAASVFLGRNKSYLSNVIKNGRTLDNYEIVVVEI